MFEKDFYTIPNKIQSPKIKMSETNLKDQPIYYEKPNISPKNSLHTVNKISQKFKKAEPTDYMNPTYMTLLPSNNQFESSHKTTYNKLKENFYLGTRKTVKNNSSNQKKTSIQLPSLWIKNLDPKAKPTIPITSHTPKNYANITLKEPKIIYPTVLSKSEKRNSKYTKRVGKFFRRLICIKPEQSDIESKPMKNYQSRIIKNKKNQPKQAIVLKPPMWS